LRTVNTTAHCLNFLDQTAAFRFSPKWESVRQLLAARSVAAAQTILFSCDHAGGPDMSVWFALPDGSIIDAIMREDAASRRYTSIVQWRTVEPMEDEMLLARRIATSSELAMAFAKAVESYYDFQSRCS
jgi:hypothetical protein